MAPPRIVQNQWAQELDDLVRGASGGFLFGIPLLYTMEVWWIGTFIDPPRMLAGLGFTYIVILLLTRIAGFRKVPTISVLQTVIEATEAMAISLVCTAAVLLLLRQITLATPLDEVVGKIIFEAIPFALGVSLGNQFLSRGRQEPRDDEQPGGQQQERQQSQAHDRQHDRKARVHETFKDLGATAIGALFVGFSIAPTEEVPMLAMALSPPWLLLLMGASLVISYGIVFESGFADARKRKEQQGVLQSPLSETIAAYLVSLAVSAGMLLLFDQIKFDDPWHLWLSHTLVLGLPAAVGGSAGRIAV